jgi:hypothetical protein
MVGVDRLALTLVMVARRWLKVVVKRNGRGRAEDVPSSGRDTEFTERMVVTSALHREWFLIATPSCLQ